MSKLKVLREFLLKAASECLDGLPRIEEYDTILFIILAIDTLECSKLEIETAGELHFV